LIFISSLDEAFVGRGIVVDDLMLLLLLRILMVTRLLVLLTLATAVAVRVEFDLAPRF
jgi:hypothetical protein